MVYWKPQNLMAVESEKDQEGYKENNQSRSCKRKHNLGRKLGSWL